MYCIQHCLICRPSDSTVSEDAWIEPRTVATLQLELVATFLKTDSGQKHKICVSAILRGDPQHTPFHQLPSAGTKAVNRGDKRTRRVRDRDFVKFERSRRYRDRYHCQEKSLAAAAPAIWFSETPPRRERDLDRCSRFATPPILP
jgi:hypothetical protein